MRGIYILSCQPCFNTTLPMVYQIPLGIYPDHRARNKPWVCFPFPLKKISMTIAKDTVPLKIWFYLSEYNRLISSQFPYLLPLLPSWEAQSFILRAKELKVAPAASVSILWIISVLLSWNFSSEEWGERLVSLLALLVSEITCFFCVGCWAMTELHLSRCPCNLGLSTVP